MSGWAPKRFWSGTSVAREAEGFTVRLDGRPLRTPAKALLALPTEALAVAVSEEWQAQGETVRPETMPMTRLANSAIDRVAPVFDAIVDIVVGYGETDLLCYRADAPPELAARQAASWDPLLDWAATRYEARLIPTTGVLPVEQPAAAIARLEAELRAASSWELAALHELVSLTGSLVLGLAVSERSVSLDEAWALSRLDEDWQITQWGRDEEAEAAAARRRQELDQAEAFLRLGRMVA
jgi:chaperone required for assembly of F1-ATPase